MLTVNMIDATGEVVNAANEMPAAEAQASADEAPNTEENGGTRSIYDLIEAEIMESDLTLDEKNKKLSRLKRLRKTSLNIMLVGPTDVGKSSTINAMFDMSVAKVGVGVNPETDRIQSYQLENLTVWDTPGLGDNLEQDFSEPQTTPETSGNLGRRNVWDDEEEEEEVR